jgi:hypothetical protein
MMRLAAVLAWVSGVGFGVPAVFGLSYFMQHHEVWTFMGFPTYGGGPFEKWDIPTSAPLLSGFIAVCVAEVAIGFLLWAGKASGLWMALALLPFELVYWIGFALPFGPILGVVRTVMVIIAIAQR